MIRRILLFAFASILMLNLPALARAQQEEGEESDELNLSERAFIASKTYSAINTYFAHWQGAPGLNLDQAYKHYLEQALAAPDRRAFSLASMEFIALLNNGHSWFIDRWLNRKYGRRIPFYATVVEGKWVVTRSDTGDLKAGDVLAAIDGEKIEEFYQRNRKYLTGSDERARKNRLFRRAVLFPPQFSLALADGRSLRVDRTAEQPERPRRETEGRWLTPGEGAYIKIPSFNDSRFQEKALGFLREFKDARALIIDVRGNAGGSTPSQLILALMDRPYRWWAESTPLHIALYEFYFEFAGRNRDLATAHVSWPAEVTQPQDPVFTGRLLILIDGACASACEDFVVPFKDNGRATLIGSTTEGSSGQPYLHNFPQGISLGIGTKREYFPDGSRFEGVGIRPDVEAPLRIRDLKTGSDSAFEKALELARQP